MSETIPEDIRKAALKVVDRGYNEGLIDAVCKALLAERERCAQIADEEVRACNEASKRAQAAGEMSEMYGRNAGLHSALRIAAQIRE